MLRRWRPTMERGRRREQGLDPWGDDGSTANLLTNPYDPLGEQITALPARRIGNASRRSAQKPRKAAFVKSWQAGYWEGEKKRSRPSRLPKLCCLPSFSAYIMMMPFPSPKSTIPPLQRHASLLCRYRPTLGVYLADKHYV